MIAPPQTVTLPRILLVDDDPHITASLAVTLRRRFRVVTAPGGPEALELLAGSASDPFTVVVADFQMPVMDGAEFLGRAREVAPEVIRLLLTGQASLDRALVAVNRGYIFRFLTKPCPPADLHAALDDAVEQARLTTADRILLEGKLATMAAHLLQAERLATLGTLASAVGHELNNILVAFQGSLEFITENAARGERAQPEDLESLDRVRDHLAMHARSLLNLGRPSRVTHSATDLAVVVRETITMLRSAGIVRNVDVRVDAPEGPALVGLDRTRAEQVLLNLLKNAIDAMNEPRSSPRRPLKLHVSIAVDRDTGIEVRIEDTGSGIAADKLTTVFEPYYTTKSKDQGTGLGLFVVKQIVESARGRISVESVVGEGTTFTVRLPQPSAGVQRVSQPPRGLECHSI